MLAILISLVCYLFWFVFLDRRFVFLYGHLHATPFDFLTASRYLMTGLVVGGIVLIVYTLLGLILKKINKKFLDWKKEWKLSALVLPIPLFIITVFAQQPQLPILLSIWTIVILLGALALALYASQYIVNNFKKSILTFIDSWSITLPLFIIPAFITFSLRKSLPEILVVAPIIIIVLSLIWLLIMNFFYKKTKRKPSSIKNNLIFALTTLYLVLPTIHYVFLSRPGQIRYITGSTNFLAKAWWAQLLTLVIVLGIVFVIAKIRKQKDFGSIKNIILILTILTMGSYIILDLTADKEIDYWSCENDKWVKIGNPDYEEPFPEECGIIDKEFGV